MVNFSYATPWLLHASLFSCKDDVTREHPHASFASAAFHASEWHVRPMSGMSKRRTKSPPPSKEDGGLRRSRIDGVRIGRAAGGLMAGALQELGRQALRKRRNRRAPCKGLNDRRAARRHTRPARWMRSARGETAGAPQGARTAGALQRAKRQARRRGETAALRKGLGSGCRLRSPPHRARRKASSPPRRSGPTSLCGRRLRC